MSAQEFRDGRWQPSVPEPLWTGAFLWGARCECGRRFWRNASVRYRAHWIAEHGGSVPVPEETS